MGEKEIKPADPKPETPKADDHPHTQEKPGTGATTPEKPVDKGGGGGGSQKQSGGGSSGSSASGHVTFEDGYKMGRDESGNTFLEHPDGGRATWDEGSKSWTRDGGGTASGDWSGGHAPTDYGPKR